MDPLRNTQSKEREQQQNLDRAHTLKFFSATRRRSLAVLFFLSISFGLLLGFFDVAYVCGLCAPLVIISVYGVCRLSFLRTTPDDETNVQFKTEEEKDLASGAAMKNADYAVRPYVLILCASYIAAVFFIFKGPQQFFFLANIFSPWCFAVYFIRAKPGNPQHASEERGQTQSGSLSFLSRKRYLAVIFFSSMGSNLLFFGIFNVKYVRSFLWVPLLAASVYCLFRLTFIHMTSDADADEQFNSGKEGDLAQDTAMNNDNNSFHLLSNHPYVPMLFACYIIVVWIVILGPALFFLLANIFSPLCFAMYFFVTSPKDRDDRAATCELPRVGSLTNDNSNDDLLGDDEHGLELEKSASTTPFIVRGILIV